MGKTSKHAGWRVQVGRRKPGEVRKFLELTAAIAHDGACEKNNYVDKIYIHGIKDPAWC